MCVVRWFYVCMGWDLKYSNVGEKRRRTKAGRNHIHTRANMDQDDVDPELRRGGQSRRYAMCKIRVVDGCEEEMI